MLWTKNTFLGDFLFRAADECWELSSRITTEYFRVLETQSPQIHVSELHKIGHLTGMFGQVLL